MFGRAVRSVRCPEDMDYRDGSANRNTQGPRWATSLAYVQPHERANPRPSEVNGECCEDTENEKEMRCAVLLEARWDLKMLWEAKEEAVFALG